MSRFYILDVETVPLPEETLLALMPNHLANPVMTPDIANPAMPEELAQSVVEYVALTEAELMDGCPAYKSKAFPNGDPEKKKKYASERLAKAVSNHEVAQGKRTTKRAEWFESAENKKMAWEERQIEAKQKFIDDAALSATTGSVKLIGLRDYVKKETFIFVAGATGDQRKTLNAATYPCKVHFLFFATEREMLEDISIGINRGHVVPENQDNESAFKLITFYGNYFDFPFMFRRAWMTGAQAPYMLRKGRYFNDAISTDLLDLWQLGDRQEKIGGMDGLAKALGTKRKSGHGEGFHRLWDSDPVAAVLYLLDDLDVTEEAAVKMGAVYMPRETVPAKGQ